MHHLSLPFNLGFLATVLFPAVVLLTFAIGCESVSTDGWFDREPTFQDNDEAVDYIMETAGRVNRKGMLLGLQASQNLDSHCINAIEKARLEINSKDKEFLDTPVGRSFQNIPNDYADRREGIKAVAEEHGHETLVEHIRYNEKLVDHAMRACD